MSALAAFRQMSSLSEQMLAAAQANDWDRLVATEKQLAVQREQLRRDAPGIDNTLSTREREQLEQLIQGMISNDAKIREIVEPWLGSVRQLLSRGSRERDLRSSYGSFTQAP